MPPAGKDSRGSESEPGTREGSGRMLPRLASFLNTPLGLWLLSSVFLSAAGFLFTEYRVHRSKQQEVAQRIEHLDIEIASRLDSVADSFIPSHVDPAHATPQALDTTIPSRVLLPPPAGFEIYPEFKARSLRSLMIELSAYLTGPQKGCVNRAAQMASFAQRGLTDGVTSRDMGRFKSEISGISNLRWSLAAQMKTPSCDDGP